MVMDSSLVLCMYSLAFSAAFAICEIWDLRTDSRVLGFSPKREGFRRW